VQNKEKTRCFF